MRAPVRILARDRPFAAAVAELAPLAMATEDSRGAVCVVPGRGLWWESVERCVGEGARAVLVVEPGAATEEAGERLAALPVPIVVSRRRLRPDVVADAMPGSDVRLVTVDAFAPRAAVRLVLRDAIGWVRELTGSTPRAASVSVTEHAMLAALQGEGPAASVVLAVGGPGTAPALQVVAIGARRVEVRDDEASGEREVTVTDEVGRLTRPARRETAERVALRRALQAAVDGNSCGLAELRSDDELAASLLTDLRS